MEKIGCKPENIQFRLKNKISLPLTGAFLDSIINMTCTALRSFISPHCDNERAICMKINELKHVPVGYVNTPLEYMPALTKKLGKGKLYVTADQAAVVTQILEGIYESDKTGKPYYFA